MFFFLGIASCQHFGFPFLSKPPLLDILSTFSTHVALYPEELYYYWLEKTSRTFEIKLLI